MITTKVSMTQIVEGSSRIYATIKDEANGLRFLMVVTALGGILKEMPAEARELAFPGLLEKLYEAIVFAWRMGAISGLDTPEDCDRVIAELEASLQETKQ